MLSKKNKTRIIVAGFVFLYVGIATVTVCSLYPKDFLYGEWSTYTLVLTLPVALISFGYRFMEADNLHPVFVVQLIVLIISLFIADLIVKQHFKKKKK